MALSCLLPITNKQSVKFLGNYLVKQMTLKSNVLFLVHKLWIIIYLFVVRNICVFGINFFQENNGCI